MRAKIRGTSSRPRLSVFRSNQFVYGQIIDDAVGRTLVGVHSSAVLPNIKKGTKSDVARAVGRELARIALEQKIRPVIFDRGGYRYQGRVRALAEGAREGGLEF